MRITASNVGDIGTLSLGSVTSFEAAVEKFIPGDAQRKDQAVVNTGRGQTTTIVVDEWDFERVVPQVEAGWYSEDEFPVSEGWSPVYVFDDGSWVTVTSHLVRSALEALHHTPTPAQARNPITPLKTTEQDAL